MFQKQDTRRGANLFQYVRLGCGAGVDKHRSVRTVVSALAAVALASGAWSAPVSAGEPMLQLAADSAPDDGTTRSEVTVSSHTDAQGRLVREITVRVVAVGEASPIDRELAAEPWSGARRPLRVLAKEALYDAFRTADTALDQTFEPLTPPGDVRQLPFVSRIAAEEDLGAVDFDVFSVQPDEAVGQMRVISTVPEPSTLVLVVAASIPLWLREKRRRLVKSSGRQVRTPRAHVSG